MIFRPVLVCCSSVRICSVSDTLTVLQRPAQSRSARRGRSGIGCGVSSVRACVPRLVWSALHPVRSALLPVLCSRSGCAGVQGGTGGVYSRRPAPPGQSFNHRKNKKGLKIAPPTIVNLKNFPQKQKDPYKGSVFCAILALQALKGRNL